MAQDQQGKGPAQGDNSLDFLWLIVILVLAVVVIWYFFRAQITGAIFFVRYYEIKSLLFVIKPIATLLTDLHLPSPNLSDLYQWFAYLGKRPTDVPFQVVIEVSDNVGRYLRYPVALILGMLGIFVYKKHIVLKFKNIFNMNSLKQSEQAIWPQSKPTMKLDLVKEPIEKGPWAMAMTPLSFSKHHKIVKPSEKDGIPVAKLIKGAAYRVFSLQTGRLWTGVDRLPIHTKALFAIFIARANHDTKASDQLLDQISSSSGGANALNFSGYQALLTKYENSKIVQRVVSKHAYVMTVMPTLLELARTDGVLASADFLWLKPIDRPLWYMLNTVGRRVAVPEVAGAYAHWLAEKELGRPIKTPMVDEAIKGIEQELQAIWYEVDEDEEAT